MSQSVRSAIPPCFFLILGVVCNAVFADNGSVAYSVPATGIKVDGNLDEWPKNARSYSIEREYFGAELPAADDFRAEFRSCYDFENQKVYFSVQVTDDHHLVPDKRVDQDDWVRHDAVTMYVDPTHDSRGSGPLIYTVIGPHQYRISTDNSWDAKVATATLDQSETAVVRNKNVTTYEWSMDVGDKLVPGRSIGLDWLICDRDPDHTGPQGTVIVWGDYGSKSQAASRIGDLVFLPADTEMGTISMSIGWHDNVQGANDGDFPRRVRMKSINHPGFWIQVNADKNGTFEMELPAGEYELTCPSEMFETVSEHWLSLDPETRVHATVVSGQTQTAPPLKLTIVEKPDLCEEKGVLFDFDVNTAAKVDRFIRKHMSYYKTPGVSLALIHDGKLAYHKVYGVKNHYTNEPVTPATLFEAASITKIVFAFAAIRMMERGELDLDKPLHEYLPWEEFEYDPRYKKITGRHCLAHRTGMPNWAWMNDDGRIDLKFYPGTRHGYSGEGTQYLGRVAEKISGKSMEQLLMDEVQKIMRLEENTYFRDCPELREVVANGHYTTRTTASMLPDSIGVAHSMHTEAKAFSNFLISILDGKGLSKHSYAAMFEPQTAVEYDDDYDGARWPKYFGLGFHLRETPYGLAVGHGGNNGDFNCLCEVLLDEKIGFAIFTNSNTGGDLADDLSKYLIEGKSAADQSATAANQ